MKKFYIFCTSLVFSLVSASVAYADSSRTPVTSSGPSYYTIFGGLYDTMRGTIFGTAPVPSFFLIVGRVVGLVVAASGSVFLVFVILGGFRWMTAAGNEEQAEGGRKQVVQALIGLGIIIGGYVIARTAVRLVTYIIG